MDLEVLSKSGQKLRTVSVSDEIFGVEPHEHSMWLAIDMYLANQRQGTHSTKGRSEVAGSTKKLFRQKGTGRARQGDIKSPLHPGGGTMFGPKPHKYHKSLPRQVKQLARKSAISQKVRESKFIVVEDFNLGQAKTKQVQDVLNALKIDATQALLLTSEYNENVYKSGRNIPTLSVMPADKASMYEIWKTRMLIVEESALKVIEQGFNGGYQEQPEVAQIAMPKAA
jgi:large subunit ribosomal protein L4